MKHETQIFIAYIILMIEFIILSYGITKELNNYLLRVGL